jgi:hypothetical protein
MKAVIFSEKGEYKRVHDLSTLFEEFSDDSRERSKEIWNKSGGVRLGRFENGQFEDHLKHASKHFLLYRYPDPENLESRLEQGGTSPQVTLQIGVSILNLFHDWQNIVKPAQPYDFFILGEGSN